MLYNPYLSTKVVRLAVTAQHQMIEKIADNGSCVIVGRAADHVQKGRNNVVRIFTHAPEEYRIGRVMEIYGDSTKMERLISILLDNALKYADEKSPVTVTLSENKDNIILTCSNPCAAMKQEQLARMWIPVGTATIFPKTQEAS